MIQWLLARIGFYPCINGPLDGKYRWWRPTWYVLRYPYGDTRHWWPCWLWEDK